MKKPLIAFSLVLITLLGACNLAQDNPEPAGSPGALYTEAAMTVSVQLTTENQGSPPSIKASSTPSPEKTLKPTATFEIPTPTSKGISDQESGTCDQIKFIKDVTIPDDMDLEPGEKFTKIWRLQNSGTCPWTIGYLLYFESGDSIGGPASIDLTSEVIEPGDTIDVSVDLVAPFETGTYQGNWKLRNVKGEGFGIGESSKPFWVKINVVEGAGMMFDFNSRAEEAVWGSGNLPVDYIDLGDKLISFDYQEEPEDAFVALENNQVLEGGRVSGILISTYPPVGEDNYIIGRFPDYKVNAGDLLFGRVGLKANKSGICGNGDIDYRIELMIGGDPATLVNLFEWNEVCDDRMKSFEIDLDVYKGETVKLFLVVIANSNSSKNMAVWDSLSIHR
jgi:hypothetical protein